MKAFNLKIKIQILSVISLVSLSQVSLASNSITPVDQVDLSKYLGTWYQISHIPQAFEYGGKPCACARQTFSISQGMVGVENTCNLLTTDGAFVDLKGSVVYSDPNPADAYASSKFTVTFNFQGQMVSGSYWVVGLDSQYRYAVVSDESGQTLYILSRNPTLPAALYDQALQEAKQQNLDISKLTLTEQNGCNYP